VAHLAGDDRDGRALAFAREVLGPFALGEVDLAEPGQEVEVSPVAAVLAVGDRRQSGRLFPRYERGDALVCP
jgi:hypothetical protein